MARLEVELRPLLWVTTALALLFAGCVEPTPTVPLEIEEGDGTEDPERDLVRVPFTVYHHYEGGPTLRVADLMGFEVETDQPGVRPWDVAFESDGDQDHLVAPNMTRVRITFDGWPVHQDLTLEPFTVTPDLAARGMHLVVLDLDIDREWTVTMDALVEPTTSRWTGGEVYWEPTELSIHDEPAANRAYIETLQHVTIRMEYTTTVTSQADLGIGFGTSPDDVLFIWDEDADPGTQSYMEHIEIDAASLKSKDVQAAEKIYVGPVSHEPIVAPESLDVRFSASFRSYEPGEGIPAPHAALGVIVLVGWLAAARRSR